MIEGLVALVIYVLVLGLVFGLLRYLIQISPLDIQFKRVANWILTVAAVLILIILLLGLVGLGPPVPRPIQWG